MARRTAIGLDIGSSGVRAAELAYGRDGARLRRFGQVPLPDTAVRAGEVVDAPVVTAALRELWRTGGFSHRDVVLGVANQRVLVREVDLPAMPLSDLPRALPFQVEGLLPMPVDSVVLDFHPLRSMTSSSGGPLVRGLLVAASRDMVMANVRAAEAAGLHVVSVDLTPFALMRALGSRLDLDVETEALVDIGAHVTNVVVHSDGEPRFVRILLTGGQHLTDAISEGTGVPPAEAEALKHEHGLTATSPEHARAAQALVLSTQALLDEIRSSVDYYSASTPTHPVQRIVVTGGGAQLRGLTERLSAATQTPVVQGNAIASFSTRRAGRDAEQLGLLGPLSAVPVGLALGAAR
ncbi:type IV pilus assembly protein PilM [Quadrisphaera sp. DSM 44207]|uniref:type IV pilus assembly protein PilM n=1 Tax=Quadrisphaera sp. DSM 44207 TaxID=1881057 RepID=UPI000888B008|nr:type IV pilus assembly protein PilM [Quadrisphaera sp. DSM 44207]SDQ46679.1 type IV pilus assembly protein PilM [Quadrisphaera sp. DSM 44207]